MRDTKEVYLQIMQIRDYANHLYTVYMHETLEKYYYQITTDDDEKELIHDSSDYDHAQVAITACIAQMQIDNCYVNIRAVTSF